MPRFLLHPDQPYLKTRAELLDYEDNLFKNLLSGVPNYYYTPSQDSSFYGHMLRGVAKEEARLEYWYHYDLWGQVPNYLTPVDIRRRYASLLSINRNYPGRTQYDTDYKQMLLDLITAYRKGATVTAIGDVIQAYTGQNFYIEELFKSIGLGYDQTDRNSLKISIYATGSPVAGAQTSSALLEDATRVKALTDDLYDAIDLAKPAHVGINLTTIFGLDEFIGQFVAPAYRYEQINGHYYKHYVNPLGIDDDLRVIVLNVEEAPLDPMLYVQPRLASDSSDTGLASVYATPFQITYQWFADSIPILGATQPLLTLGDVEVSPLGFKHLDVALSGTKLYVLAQMVDAHGVPMRLFGNATQTVPSPLMQTSSQQVSLIVGAADATSLPNVPPSVSPAMDQINQDLVFTTQPYGTAVRADRTVTFTVGSPFFLAAGSFLVYRVGTNGLIQAGAPTAFTVNSSDTEQVLVAVEDITVSIGQTVSLWVEADTMFAHGDVVEFRAGSPLTLKAAAVHHVPFPGLLSPRISQVWEITDDGEFSTANLD